MILLVIYKFKIYCSAEGTWKYVWSDVAPTVCPTNNGHSVNAASVSIDDQIQAVSVNNSDSPYKVKDISVFSDTSSGNITLQLPKAARSKGLNYVFKQTSASNSTTISAYSGDLIDGGATLVLSSLNQTYVLTSDGTNWSSVDFSSILPLQFEIKSTSLVSTRQKGDILIDNAGELMQLNVVKNTHSLVADSTQPLGVRWAQLDHVNLANKGTNTHAQIDTHISDISGVHGVTGSVVGTSDTQTLTNKTLTAHIISTISNGGTITIPTSTDTLVGRATTDTLSNKSLNNNTTFFVDNSTPAKRINFTTTGSSANTLTIASVITADRTITMPDATTTIVGTDTTQILTNKTLTRPVIVDISNTGIITLPTTTTTLVGIDTIDTLTNKTLTRPVFVDISNNGILTLPSGTTDTLVGRATVDTLSNKTFGSDLDLNNYKIVNLGTPTQATDAVTKSYVDGVTSSLTVKIACYVATVSDLSGNSSISGAVTYNATGGTSTRGQITATLAVSNAFTIDNKTMSNSNNGARILVKNQSSGAQNGIWILTIAGTSLTLNRATDLTLM